MCFLCFRDIHKSDGLWGMFLFFDEKQNLVYCLNMLMVSSYFKHSSMTKVISVFHGCFIPVLLVLSSCLNSNSIFCLCHSQLIRRPRSNYMEALQRDITKGMRGILIDWLVEVDFSWCNLHINCPAIFSNEFKPFIVRPLASRCMSHRNSCMCNSNMKYIVTCECYILDAASG